ncbi:uncharacterized protein LOC111345501 [Stylophora pistillata]|uniref:uncharacterized protein LOC111345501 n=1 Tax=Stylophora pistillata TaxID=50429 RepID=UPI000C0483E5|nr:uncharacterized protein LOC111345501 [Stylophora pistillata]
MEKDSSRQRTSRFPRIQHKDEKMLNDWIKNKQITTTMTILKAIDPSNSCLSQDCDPKGSESETCQLDTSFINRLQAVPPPLTPHSQSSSRHVQLAFFQFTDFFFFFCTRLADFAENQGTARSLQHIDERSLLLCDSVF